MIDEMPMVAVTDTNVGCKWISCSERMPCDDEDVLVSVDFDNKQKIATANHFKGKWYFDDEYYSCTDVYYRVLAWMPLPEPYREDGDSDG